MLLLCGSEKFTLGVSTPAATTIVPPVATFGAPPRNCDAKPSDCAWAVYVPGARPLTMKRPCVSVTVLRRTAPPVAGSTTSTPASASGVTPSLRNTRPEIVP